METLSFTEVVARANASVKTRAGPLKAEGEGGVAVDEQPPGPEARLERLAAPKGPPQATLLADRYLLLDQLDGSTLCKCLDVRTRDEYVCKVTFSILTLRPSPPFAIQP